VALSLNQRLLREFNLNVSGSYSKTEYTESLLISGPTRDDNQYSFSVALSHSFLKHGNVSVNYQYSDNQSNFAGYTYNSSQIGISIGYAY
jgi:uncharacterized protein (PEP-CTERM system associated)